MGRKSFLFMALARRKERNWCFTINNFSEIDEDCVIDLADRIDVLRVIAEHEHLNEGTPHIQGYVSFSEPKQRETVQMLLGGRAHVEKALGGWKQNVRYCSKENQVIVSKNCLEEEDGVQDGRVTLSVIEAAKTLDVWEFEDRYPLVWFHHRAKVLNCMMDSAIRRVSNWDGDLKAKNYWIWGPPGIGKSMWAAAICNETNQYKKSVNKWWDGYNIIRHKVVMLEDFPITGQMFAQHMKIWADRYFFMGECKGSSMIVEPGRFFLIVTSNYPIEACFEQIKDIEAIQRRFTEFEVTPQNKTMFQNLRLDFQILKT